MTLKQYGTDWLATADEATRVRLEYEFRLHVYPFLGDMPLTAVQPSKVNAPVWKRAIRDAGIEGTPDGMTTA